jgi:hypothetical protein
VLGLGVINAMMSVIVLSILSIGKYGMSVKNNNSDGGIAMINLNETELALSLNFALNISFLKKFKLSYKLIP